MPRPLSRRAQANAKAEKSRRELHRQLRWAIGLSLLAGAIAGVLIAWDRILGITPEQVVRVYRTHGCVCVVPWIKAVESGGFVVRATEVETLEHVRLSLAMPQELQGCHVGVYLGYFVEGHVSAKELRQLAAQRPTARGVAVQVRGKPVKEHTRVQLSERESLLLFDGNGQSRVWPAGPA